MYVLFLHEQPANFTLPTAIVASGAENETKFDIGGFTAQVGLERAIGGQSLFLSEYVDDYWQ